MRSFIDNHATTGGQSKPRSGFNQIALVLYRFSGNVKPLILSLFPNSFNKFNKTTHVGSSMNMIHSADENSNYSDLLVGFLLFLKCYALIFSCCEIAIFKRTKASLII